MASRMRHIPYRPAHSTLLLSAEDLARLFRMRPDELLTPALLKLPAYFRIYYDERGAITAMVRMAQYTAN